MHKKEETRNPNKNVNYNRDVPDYSSTINGLKNIHPEERDDYDVFAKELNPDDFE